MSEGSSQSANDMNRKAHGDSGTVTPSISTRMCGWCTTRPATGVVVVQTWDDKGSYEFGVCDLHVDCPVNYVSFLRGPERQIALTWRSL